MIIFAKKHFSPKNASLFSFFINLAIYFRAGAAIIYRFLKKTMMIGLDIILLFCGLFLVKLFWEKFSYGNAYKYPGRTDIQYFPGIYCALDVGFIPGQGLFSAI